MDESNIEILRGFHEESTSLVQQLFEVLDEVEDDSSQFKKLEVYGNVVDRIMGGAQSLAMQIPEAPALVLLGDISALCKIVSYKASQVTNNQQLIEIVVALLQDATEVLEQALANLEKSGDESVKALMKKISSVFAERLLWATDQFDRNLRSTVGASAVTNQPAASGASSPAAGGKSTPTSIETDLSSTDQVEALLKKLGVA